MRYKCCASEEGMSSRSAEMNTLHPFGSYSGPVMGSFYHSSCRKDQGTFLNLVLKILLIQVY